MRGVDAHPDRIVVCAGFGHAFDLLAQVLHDRVFAVEDPGYPPPRARLARAGIPVEAVRIDAQGLVVEQLRVTAARVAVGTPAHQSPNGVDPVCALRAGSDVSTSAILAPTFAELLRAGDLDRHLRLRRVYRARRDAVVSAVRRWLPEATAGGIAAGLSAVLDLPPSLDEQAVVAGAAERGVRVYARAPFHVRPGGPGLVLGYGAVPPEAAELGVRLLADAVRAIVGPRASPRRARVHLVDGASACAGSVVPP